MHLKSLTLKGFKSFADATTLELEPGVTVVVGPNGSGKSNLVDAIAWVLGAQGPSTMRGGKMDDVIFAGTAERPALGRAEVELCIDNASGVLPIEFNEVRITRTLFRDGDSEYRINGAPCRLLDITELLSDSGIGRHQHVIVGQGNLDEVLKAKPLDRRLIIEEAAGVLKYRKRKEKAERRLASTEANLLRLQDLAREVRRQLRPLERQADAARRHGSVVAELRALRTHLAGKELESTRARLEATRQQLGTFGDEETELRRHLTDLDEQVAAAERELGVAGADDTGDDLALFEALNEKARGLDLLLAERARRLEREKQAALDEGVVATLEAEASRLRTELDELAADEAQLGPARDELAHMETELEAARFSYQASFGEAPPEVRGRAAELRGELGARRTAVGQHRTEIERLGTREASLGSDVATLVGELERLATDLASAEETLAPLADAIDAADAAVAQATTERDDAEARLRAAERELATWSARHDALALALDEARARAGAERLEGVDGVLGTLLDLVQIDDGYEAAFEAAAADALESVVVADARTGRDALARLRSGDLTGAVLVASIGRAGRADSLPGIAGLRDRVRATDPQVDPLLDRLLGSVVVAADPLAAVDLATAHPDAVVVTTAGDRFGPSGWRLGTGGAGATRAALVDAREHRDEAATVVEERRQSAAATAASLREAVAAHTAAVEARDGAVARVRTLTDGRSRVESDRRTIEAERLAVADRLVELRERLAADEARIAELDELSAEATHAETIAEQAAAVGALRVDVRNREANLAERRLYLEGRRTEIDDRLAAHEAERATAAERRIELEQAEVVLERLREVVTTHAATITTTLDGLREQRRAHSEAVRAVASRLDDLRGRRQAEEKRLEEIRERQRRVEIEQTETRVKLENLTEAIRVDLELEPDQVLGAPCPELPDGMTARQRARDLERELKLMGPINPLALEEFEALRERDEFLQGQLEDVKNSRRELAKVIRAIDTEIVEVFAAAFADVSANFEKLFGTLFPGGRGRILLSEPDDLLGTGVELEARPAGKNVKQLSLLSGGERSLTAMAFLFSVFRSRPSPFYVLDEVEAALDDINLHRFLDLVAEFRKEAQLLIVSHQKRTMESADCLYGVSMQTAGSSKVVSERLSTTSS